MKRIPICMPVYNRPAFLRQTLEALLLCQGLKDFMIITSEEPGCAETSKLLDRYLPQMGVPHVRHVNEVRLGCSKNVERSLDHGFDTGADVVFSLEDDVVLAKDALLWLKWASSIYKHEPRVMAAAAWSKQEESYMPKLADLNQMWLSSQFIAWGYAVNRERFEEYRFVFDESVADKMAWDMKLTMYMPGNFCMVVHPKVSRAQNIGCEGTGIGSVQFWKDNHYVNNFISDVWKDYPTVEFLPVTDEERRNNDRACLLGRPEGKVPLVEERNT